MKTSKVDLFLIKHMDLIKKIVFLPPQIMFCIYTATIFLLSQILKIFEMLTETLCSSALTFIHAPHQKLPLTSIL